MSPEKGAIIVAYQDGKRPRFLVLKRSKNWEGWELPKGHLEEDLRSTALEELKEEAGISEEEIEELEELDEKVEWSFEVDGEEHKRSYTAFRAQISGDAVVDVSDNPDEEHEEGFFFRYRDAESLLTYGQHRELLEQVYQDVTS
ncbi:MAG: NUDIX domain-containing protein [Candidatus Nanohaloarchaea archaeon]